MHLNGIDYEVTLSIGHTGQVRVERVYWMAEDGTTGVLDDLEWRGSFATADEALQHVRQALEQQAAQGGG
jgi:hypothetical protein